VRREILETLAKFVWVQETARRELFGRWGEPFHDRREAAARRAELAEDWLESEGLPVPAEVLPDHLAWWHAMAGARPDERAGGAVFADFAGGWVDTYVGDRLGIDFAALLPTSPLPAVVSRAPKRLFDPILDRVALGDRARPIERATTPCFAMLNDVHVGERGAAQATQAIVEDLNRIGPQFVVVVGDITHGAEPENFREARAIFDKLEMPYYAVMGNHEVVQQSTMEMSGDELFEETFGYRSVSRLLTCGDLQLGLLDSTDRTAWSFPMPNRPGGKGSVGVIHGAFDDRDIEMLVDETDPGRPLLLASHHQFHPFTGFPALLGGVLPSHTERLLSALADKDLLGILAGHTHRSALTTVGDGVPQLELPATGKWPYGFAVITPTPAGADVVVRQVSDHDLVRQLTEDQQDGSWAFGPQSALHHVFERRHA